LAGEKIMLAETILFDICNNITEEALPKSYSFLVTIGNDGKTTELLVNGSPACLKTTGGDPVDLAEFIDISLNIPEEHLNNFPEDFDEESIKILSALNWCKVGGKWVTCKGPCP
jgi:hypothetical protein